MGSKSPRKKRLPSLIIGILTIGLGIISLFLSASADILSAIGYILLSVVLLMVGSIILIIRYFTAPAPTSPPSKSEKTPLSFRPSPAITKLHSEYSAVKKRSDLPEPSINLDRIFRHQVEFDFPSRYYPTSRSSSTSRPNSYVVLDVETTGLSPEMDSIIEFGAIRIENGHEVDCFTTYINPGCPIPQRITQITGITEADVASAPNLQTTIQTIASFIGDSTIVAHNASFDLAFLRRAYIAAGLPAKFDTIDTLRLARTAFPDAPNYKLSTLIDYLHLGGTQSHRALSDVRYTNLIYQACLSAEVRDNL